MTHEGRASILMTTQADGAQTQDGPNGFSKGPTISVLLPVHNAAPYLDEAIRSIRRQTFRDFELLILDDGSTDESPQIARRHAEEDPRIRILELERVGLARALNTGLKMARAPWIARMDADDIAHPERFERQLSFLRNRPEVALVGTYAWMIGPNGRIVGESNLGPTSLDEFFKLRDEIGIIFLHPSVMYSRQTVLDEGGYSEDYPAAEDYELWNRLASRHLMLSIPEPLLYYRIHPSATGTSSMRLQAESAARAKENIRRQRQGREPVSVEEFRALRQRQGLLRRARRELALRSRHAYRVGGALLACGDPRGFAWLIFSLAIYPPIAIDRVRRQVLSPLRRRGLGRVFLRFSS